LQRRAIKGQKRRNASPQGRGEGKRGWPYEHPKKKGIWWGKKRDRRRGVVYQKQTNDMGVLRRGTGHEGKMV